MKGSASVTLATLTVHLLTLAILMLASVVLWARNGNSTLAANRHAGQVRSGGKIAKAVYQGICIAFLHRVSRSYRRLEGRAPGGWLSVLVTVDAVLILAATVLAGLVSAIALLHRLSHDGSLPRGLLKPLPWSGVPAFAVALFAALCIIVYASSGASLGVVSSMFAIVFLAVMSFYPVSLLLLQYHRPTIPRLAHRTPFLLTISTLILALALISGVISHDPTSVGYFAAYMCILALALWTAAR
ncbi:hypothetical protein JCM10296v2_005317 [Rhodotorula toruloides]